MKVSHRKNIKRRKTRFGYESNSLIGLDLADATVNSANQEDEENPFDDVMGNDMEMKEQIRTNLCVASL